MTIKFICFNDPHICHLPPSPKRVDNYEEACFDKLNQISLLAQKHSVDFLVCTGDWFHKKIPAAVPHSLVTRTMLWLDSLDDHGGPRLRVYTVAGNHDVRFFDTSTESVKKQPIGVLATHRNFVLLKRGDVYQIFEDGASLAITGSPYVAPQHDGNLVTEDLSQFSAAPSSIADPIFNVHISHANVVGEIPQWAPYTLAMDALKATSAKILLSGHIHDDVGIFKGTNSKGQDAYFANIGSITRGALTERMLERKPQVLLVEVDIPQDRVSFARVDLVCKPTEEIYDIAAYRESQIRKEGLSVWSSKLRQELEAGDEVGEEAIETIIQTTELLDNPSRELARVILNEVGG